MDRLRYRGLSFDPPRGWSAASRIQLGDATVPDGAIISVATEPRPRGTSIDATVDRKLAELRARVGEVEILRVARVFVAKRPARRVRLRITPKGSPAVVGQLLEAIDHGDPAAFTTLSLTVPEARLADRMPTWSAFVRGVRLDEVAPKAPRIRPHVAAFEPPAEWAEALAWTFRAPAPDPASIVVQLEPSMPGVAFRTLAERKARLLSEGRELVASAPVLAVGGHPAHRIHVRMTAAPGAVIEEITILVDGGGTPENCTAFSVAAPAGAIAAAEATLTVLLESVRIGTPEPGPMPRRAVVQGASVRGLALAKKTPADVHVELMRRGFVPSSLPITVATTRIGQRRFLREDGRATSDLADPRLASELVYLHDDGGAVRVFPGGQPSAGLGGLEPGSVRKSVLPIGTRDVSLDAEELVIGNHEDAVLPRTVHGSHGQPPSAELAEEAGARQLLLDTWTRLAPGPAVVLPLQDRVGLRISRTIVVDGELDVLVGKVERLAAAARALRIERDGTLRFYFASSRAVLGCASLAVDLGTHVLSVEPIGHPTSVSRLQRFLRQLLVGEVYRVFDDATGEDVTATVLRMPSFLVAPTRRRPVLFTSAG